MSTVNELAAAGFSREEIDDYTTKKAAEYSAAGFSQEEIVVALTGQKPPNDDAMRRTFETLLDARARQNADPAKPLSFAEALESGWGYSVGVPGVWGLAGNGKVPDLKMTGQEPWYTELGFAGAQMIGDIPASILGIAVGGAGGIETGPGAIATAGAGAFAMPAALRATMIDAYEKGEFKSFSDFAERAGGIFMETAKAYVIGAVSPTVGGTAGERVGGAIGGKIFQTASPLAAKVGYTAGEIGTMVTLSAAMEGSVPDVNDFASAAILLMGAKIGKRGYDRARTGLMNVYKKTGIPPWKVAEDAKSDPTIVPDLAAGLDVPRAYENQVDPVFRAKTPQADQGPEPITVYHGTPEQNLDRPTTKRAVETPDTIFAAAHDDVAETFTLPREYGEPVYVDAAGNDIAPGKVIPLEIYPKNIFEVAAENAQKFIDDTAYQTQVIREARQAGHDVVVARGVLEGIGERRKTDVYAILDDAVMDKPAPREPVMGATSGSGPTGSGGAPRGPTTVAGIKRQRGILLQIAAKLGIKVDVTNDGNYYSEIFNGRVTIPDDANPNLPRGIASADHVFAHELGHAIVSRFGAIFGIRRDPNGRFYIWSNKKLRREISNWDDFTAASKEFRPEFWNDASLGQQKYVRTPDELVADTVAMVLMGKRDISILGPMMKMLGMKPESMGINVDNISPGEIPDVATTGPEPGSLREAQETVLSKVDIGGQTPKKRMSIGEMYRKFLDDLDPINQAVKDLTDGVEWVTGLKVELPASANPYVMMRLMRGVYGRAQAFLENATYDFGTLKNNGKSLREILKPFSKDLDGLRAYVVSKRAMELKGRALVSGINIDAAAKVVTESQGKYEAAFRDLVDYQNRLTKYLRDSGIVSDELYKRMLELNKDFVPFYRLLEDTSTQGGAPAGSTPRNPIKTLKGSGMEIIDPIESIIKNTYTYLALAERNAAVKQLYDLGMMAGKQNSVFTVKQPKTDATTLTPKEMEKLIKEAFGPYAGQVMGLARLKDFTVFRAAHEMLRSNEIQFFQNGKRVVLETDEILAMAFRNLDRENVSALVNLLSIPASTLRAGATLNPEYFLRNVFRDQWSAYVQSKVGFKMWIDGIAGAFHILGKTESFNNFLKSGGANATLVSMDRQYIQSEIYKLIKERPETNFLGKTWNVIKTPMEMLQVLNEFFENSTRVGEFARSMQFEAKKGNTNDRAAIMESGFRSREVITDFARKGAQMRALNLMAAFFNAQLQSYDQLYRVMKENPKRALTATAMSITLPSVLLWFANKDDPRWKDIAGWERDMFWIVMTDDHIYRLPKPFELGVLFGSVPERLLDHLYNDGSDWQLQDFTKRLLGSFALSPFPTAVEPIVEQTANYSFFRGTNLIPSWMEDKESGVLPEYRYSQYTTETAKALGGILGQVPMIGDTRLASPIVLENYVRAWTGGLGTYALQAADYSLRKAGVVPDPVTPTTKLEEIPFIKAFMVRHPGSGSAQIQEFMDRFKQRQIQFNSALMLARSGDFLASQRLLTLNPEAMVRLKGIDQALSQHNQLIRLIYKDPNTSADDKRQQIDAAYYNMIEMAKRANEAMDQIDANLENADRSRK